MTNSIMAKAVIFDMDGVVVNSMQADYHAWEKIFKENSIAFSNDVFKSFLGMKSRDIIKRLVKKEATDEEAISLEKKKEAYFLDCAKQELTEITGVTDLLKELQKQNIPTALATGGTQGKADFVLATLGLKNYFTAITTADNVSEAKPNPEIFLKSAQKLTVAPNDCVVIEDAQNGIQAAKAAGMKVIGITTTHTQEELSNADKVIDNYSQLSLETIQTI